MRDEIPDLDFSPTILVIFGITGDLSTRKLLPALYELTKNGLINPKTQIIGITRRHYTKEEIAQKIRPGITSRDGKIDDKILTKLLSKIKIYKMSSVNPKEYPQLADYLDSIEKTAGVCLKRLYYLAVPPQISGPIITNLGEQGLNVGCREHSSLAHLLLEKPFGFDLKTATELIELTTKYFSENQIFRIDHYLAKETVQNIVTFRFRNPIFDGLWDKEHIKSIEIEASEKIDIEGRGNFYEQTGALRDLIQSHLLYVMSLVLMSRPKDITSSKDMHKERLKALEQVEPIPADKILERAFRGQYEGYREEVNIPASFVETFAVIKLYSRDSRWEGVPITIKTGKALAKKETKITIAFCPKNLKQEITNQLIFYIQPDEGITIELWAKKPGFKAEIERVPMNFRYDHVFGDHITPDAYERVLVDATRGDNTLFATSQEVLSAWKILQPLLDYWRNTSDDLAVYKKGSPGPDISRLR